MQKVLLNTYAQMLWSLFVANNEANGVDLSVTFKQQVTEFWNQNVSANVPASELPAATLQNLYELAHGDDENALASVKSIL
jgi:hypothetical protein